MPPVTPDFEQSDSADALFERIAQALSQQSWCVIPDALPVPLVSALTAQLSAATLPLRAAGVGRGQEHQVATAVRSDAIHWIDGSTAAEQAWLQWAEALRLFLNRRLFMGLDSFESHFAHYAPGAFYSKHRDAFRGAAAQSGNRILSVVAYFNPQWQSEDGGALVLYDEAGELPLQEVSPHQGTLVVFLSADVPHEVLPARRDRYSIALWYRDRAAPGTL